MTTSSDVPLKAVRKLARSFAQWLQRGGFAPPGRIAPVALFRKVDHARVEDDAKARVIRGGLHWLVLGALAPARRNVARRRLKEDASELARIALGNEATELARKFRNIIAKAETLTSRSMPFPKDSARWPRS